MCSAVILAATYSPVWAQPAEIEQGGTFKILINRDIDSFDSAKVPSPDLARLQVLFASHEGLFEYHPDTDELEPRLALSATHNEDYTSWTVKLRPGVKFSNGEDLTAEAYAVHFERLMASPVASTNWAYAGFVPKAVVAVDPLTIRFDLESPSVAFDTIMGFPLYIWPLSEPGYVKEHGADEDFGRHAVGAGPYMLKEWVPGQHVTMVKNPYYWNPDEQIADEFEFVVITGPERGANWAALQAGDVDIDWSSGDLVDWAKNQTDFDLNLGFRSSSGLMYNFNTATAPFDDIRVRQAFAHGINRDALVRVVYQNGQTVADQAFPPTSKWYCEDLEVPAYDPDLARSLLADYGQPLPSIEIWSLTGPFQAAAEVLQGMLSEIGVNSEVKMAGTSPAQISAAAAKGEAPSWFLLGGSTVHPTTYQKNLKSDDPANIWRMNSDEIDDALSRLGAARTDEEMMAAHCDFEQAKWDELPYIYLTYNIAGIMSKPEVRGLKPPSTEALGFTRVYREVE